MVKNYVTDLFHSKTYSHVLDHEGHFDCLISLLWNRFLRTYIKRWHLANICPE